MSTISLPFKTDAAAKDERSTAEEVGDPVRTHSVDENPTFTVPAASVDSGPEPAAVEVDLLATP